MFCWTPFDFETNDRILSLIECIHTFEALVTFIDGCAQFRMTNTLSQTVDVFTHFEFALFLFETPKPVIISGVWIKVSINYLFKFTLLVCSYFHLLFLFTFFFTQRELSKAHQLLFVLVYLLAQKIVAKTVFGIWK